MIFTKCTPKKTIDIVSRKSYQLYVCIPTSYARLVGAGADSALMSVRFWDSKLNSCVKIQIHLSFKSPRNGPPPIFGLENSVGGFRIPNWNASA